MPVRQERLGEIAQQWGVELPPPSPPLERPSQAKSYRTNADEFHAEELVKRKQLSHGRTDSTGNLRKAFSSSKKKVYEPSVVFNALNSHVANRGSPGVAEALISLLTNSGGDFNLPQKPKAGLLSRRRSLENFGERSKLLQQAVQSGQLNMVEVLIPHADTVALDTSLPIAMRNENLPMVELLLRYGAGAASTAASQDALRQACVVGGKSDLVSLVLSSEGRPSMTWISQCMVDASRVACLPTVLHLSRSTSDGNFNQAEALKIAISQSRRDIIVAILMGSRPPSGKALDEAFSGLMNHPSMNPNEKVAIAEVLLCAGADGNAPADALMAAAGAEFLEMISMLVAYGISIEHQDAKALRHAINNGRFDVAHILLSGKSPLSSVQASECVELIPKSLAAEHRRILLESLLRKGANGNPLNEILIEAAEAGDVKSVSLLLTPQFPGGQPVRSNGIPRRASASMVFERHEVASIDYKGGLALQIATRRGDALMVKAMLRASPSRFTQTSVFSQVKTLSSPDRYRMTECFLETGLPAPTVQEALQEAIDVKPGQRDEGLIALLLEHTHDVNTNDGALIAAVAQEDVNLLRAFLLKKVNPQMAGNVLPRVMEVGDPKIRLEMTTLILNSVTGIDPLKASSALLHVLKSLPGDIRLIQALLQLGRADINVEDGTSLALAIREHEPPVVNLLLKDGQASTPTLNRGLGEICSLQTSAAKAAKLKALLEHTQEVALLNDILVKEVRQLLKIPTAERSLSIVEVLLAAGADVNSHSAAALCHAVAASDQQLTDALFTDKLTTASLASALPHALSIANTEDRLAFSKRLLDAGAPSAEANRALGFAIRTYTNDIPLLRQLSFSANTTDGEALIAGVKRERPDIVEMVLQRKHTKQILNSAFNEATKVQNKEARALICTLLLRNGASGSVVSDALQAAATDGDLVLGNLLISHGVEVNDQAIIEACRSGAADVLSMLLSGEKNPEKRTLERGFQAATEVGDLKQRAAVLAPLLARGVGVDALNQHLVSAVRFGSNGDDLVKILLRHGADPNYYNGEAVWAATRSAYLVSLELLLGIRESTRDSNQPRPTEATLRRALDACWKLSGEYRLVVLDMIFKAGLPVTEELHIILGRAVNEDEPDEKAIEALVRHGALPTTKGCRSLIDATQKGNLNILKALLLADVSPKDLDHAVEQSFTRDNAKLWFSDPGFLLLESYLMKGAEGPGLSSVLLIALDMASDNPPLAGTFVDALFKHDVDVDYEDGKLLESAASAQNVTLIQRLLEKRPSSESITRAFHRVFDRPLPEDEALALLSIFTDYADGETRLDVMYSPPKSAPIMFLALSQYPRSTKITKALLDAGYFYDQTTVCRVMPEMEGDETVTLLTWALLQPQKRISSGIIQILIDAGAKVNFETRQSRITPLMLAVQARRPDVVKMLLLEGAEVDVTDVTGNTPLAMATSIGGEVSVTMMTSLLAAGASKNDGSLHNAARELNMPAVQVLVEYGHDPDFPSHLHDGRSALGEVCLHVADASTLDAAKEKQAEKIMNFLIETGSDLSLKSSGKSVLHLSLDSGDPTVTTKLLLKAGMWKNINKKFNFYTDGKYTYSPTTYVSKVLPESDIKDQLLALLRANRCEDVYYSNTGPQPDDAVGLPEDIAQQDREHRARLSRLASEEEDHKLSMARSRELAAVQAQIWANQAEMEDRRRKRAQSEEIVHLGQRAQAEEQAYTAAARRRASERASVVAHEKQITDVAATRSRMEIEQEKKRQMQALDWEKKIATERVDHNKALSAMRISEREEIERMDNYQDQRVQARMAEQRRLIETQSGLAGQIAGPPMQPRRQIGYVAGELN